MVLRYAFILMSTLPRAGDLAHAAQISYGGTVIAACGVFPSIAVVLAWAGGSAGGDVKRGVALAMTIGVGNLGGICSSFIYRTVDSPQFHPGHGTVIGCMIMSYVSLVWAAVRAQHGDANVSGQILCVVHYDGHI